MNTHSFSIEIAEELGVNCAILYQSIEYWCVYHKANNTNFHEGKTWVYNSTKAWKELFPYLGEHQIKTALKKLEDEEYIVTGKFNKDPYNHTKWFSPIRLAKTTQSRLAKTTQSTITTLDNTFNDDKSNGKEEKIKQLKTDTKEAIDYLNSKTGKSYKASTHSTVMLIQARLHQGYELKDIKTVIDNKCKEWLNTDMSKFLRPETLFNATKFEGYLFQEDKESEWYMQYAR